MNGFVDIYTIIFLVIAVVVFLRLRNVLGRRTGNERPPFDPFSRRESVPGAATDKVVNLPRRTPAASPDIAPAAEENIKVIAPAGSTLNEGLKAIAAVDRTFDPKEFIVGAKSRVRDDRHRVRGR